MILTENTDRKNCELIDLWGHELFDPKFIEPPFGASEEEIREAHLNELRESYRQHTEAWLKFCNKPRVCIKPRYWGWDVVGVMMHAIEKVCLKHGIPIYLEGFDGLQIKPKLSFGDALRDFIVRKVQSYMYDWANYDPNGPELHKLLEQHYGAVISSVSEFDSETGLVTNIRFHGIKIFVTFGGSWFWLSRPRDDSLPP